MIELSLPSVFAVIPSPSSLFPLSAAFRTLTEQQFLQFAMPSFLLVSAVLTPQSPPSKSLLPVTSVLKMKMMSSLVVRTRIKANRKLFKSVTAVTEYVETFLFGEDRLMIQIQTIENCKAKLSTRATAYARLSMNFLEDGSWRESKWTSEQLTELMEPVPSTRSVISGMKGK